MKFTVNRTELLAAAQNAERIAPRVSTIEILQCAYLQAEQDTLTVASSNLEIALEQQLPAQIESEGSVVVKAPLLSGMLRLLDGERVTFQMKNGKLVVSSGNAEYAIPVMDAAQYPRMEIPCPAATVPVSGIPSLTKRTAFAVSEDTTRPMLKCVNLIFGADGLQAVSTDSFRIASAKGDRESRGNISFLVPAASLEKLAGLVSDREKLQVLLDHGTNRISVNPQTLDDRVLETIGRRHTADDIRRAMEQVRAANFPHVNMDLIAGLPEDTPDGFARSLDEVISMGADNITVHTLSLKKGSRIMLEGSRIPGADEVAQMLDYADPTLRKHGFAPYYLYRQKYMSGSFENVGWTKPGGTGLYNIYIMEELHSILSLGAGGSTKMVSGGQIRRAFNAKYPREYIDRPEKRRANLMDFARFYAEQGE